MWRISPNNAGDSENLHLFYFSLNTPEYLAELFVQDF